MNKEGCNIMNKAKNRSISILLVAVILIGLLQWAIGGNFAFASLPAPSGTGTQADPYLITSLNDLLWVQDQSNNQSNNFRGKYFRQTADIDLISISD